MTCHAPADTLSPSGLRVVADRKLDPAASPIDGRAAVVRVNLRKGVIESQAAAGGVIVPGDSQVQTVSVAYGADLVAGQVVYLANGVAYPVISSMIESVLFLLALVTAGGPVNAVRTVLLQGLTYGPFSFTPGRVYIGAGGFPSSADDPGGHYVPIGYSAGGSSLHFLPRERFTR